MSDFITVHDKIHRRSGHIAFSYKGYMMVWGGYRESMQETSTSPVITQYHDTDEVWCYDTLLEDWKRMLTKGDIPPRTSGSAYVLVEDALYIFGGYQALDDPGSMEGNSNQLYRLCLSTLTWEWLHPSGDQPTPCDKLMSWAYKGKLYFFGGFGPPPEYRAPYSFVIDVTTQNFDPRGWSNQLVVYNPETNKWEWPRSRGLIPCPRAAHSGDRTGSKVFMFGGRFKNVRLNDLHCLDLNTMHWSGNLTRPFEEHPEGRSWHSFKFVTKTRAVIYGGFNQLNTVLNDCWLMDLDSNGVHSWKELILPYDHGEPRCWHGCCLSKNGELFIHSGLTQPYYENRVKLRDHAEDLLVLYFSPRSLLMLCFDAVMKYHEFLMAEWWCLPRNLVTVLEKRLEQYY